MTQDPLDQLRAELMAVEPSPAFAAGVRARVAAPSRAGFRWQFALATGAVIVAAVASGAYWLQRGSAVVPGPAPAVDQSVPIAAAERVVTPVPTPQATRRARAAQPVAQPVAAAASTGPFLEVITNQPEMIRRARSRLQAEIKVEPSHASEVIETSEIPIAPVAVREVQGSVIGGLIPILRSMK